jgi:hypothetical protein
MSIQKQLEKELPEFLSLEDRFLYQQEKALQLFFKEMIKLGTLEEIEKKWIALSEEQKKQIYDNYHAPENRLDILAQAIVNQKNLVALDFLLIHDFKFNKHDIDLLKENHWMQYQPVGDNYNITVYYHDFTFSSIYENIKTRIKKILRIKPAPAFYMIEYFNKDLLEVLSRHLNKLPTKIKAKVIRELPQEKFDSLLVKEKSHKLAFFNRAEK